ncbi:MAG: peptidylprolyl isomerase [Spirochaetaceae bacterium]|nr:peptidylprolyl isomerase [Spirochaetaceae bacterium]
MKQIEKKKQSSKKILLSIGSVFILILAALIFIFLPAMVGSVEEDIKPFGYYDGKPIEYKQGTYFADSVQYYSDQRSAQIQTLEDEYEIFNDAFQSTVLNMGYTMAVQDSGYIVPEELLNRNMRVYFYDENNQFSQKLYNETPESTKKSLWENTVNSLEYMRYQDDVFGSMSDVMGDYSMYGLKSSSKEVPFIQQMGAEKRSFDYVAFNTSDYPIEEALAWAKNHTDLFTQYDMSVISVSDESTANKLLKQLQNNEILFEDAVAEYSRNYYSSSDGKLTSTYNYQIKNIVTDEASFDAITNLTVGTLSGVIPTVNGYSIFRADNASTAPDFENQDVAKTIQSYMVAYESGIIESYYIDLARDFANRASLEGFREASDAMGLKVETITDTPLNYGDNNLLQTMSTTSSGLAYASTNESFLKTAFSMKLNEVSSPIVLNGNVVVLNMTGETFSDNDTMMYMYYMTTFDRASVNNAFLSSPKLENNVLNVFFSLLK